MTRDAATRMVAKAEERERAKALIALERWLPMRKAHLALVPLADRDAVTDASIAEALIAHWSRLPGQAHSIGEVAGE